MTNKISFPQMGFYHIPISYIIKNITKCDVIIPSHNNISLGSKYSPNEVCMPFKYNLGDYLKSLEQGANILIQAAEGCRYGNYAELQEQIIKELGYNITFINLTKNNHVSILKLYKEVKKINHKLNYITYFYYLLQGILMIIFMDKITKYIREHQAISSNKEKIIEKKLYNAYSKENLSIIKIIKIYHKLKKELLSIPNKEINRVKILLIGEPYTLMDQEANHHIEENLINNNTIVYRYTDLTYLLIKKKFARNKILKNSKKYLKYTLGAAGAESVFHAIYHAKNGIDGIIHIKSFGCAPEINAIPILSKICEDYNIPIMYLSYNGENNITNIDTKIESFYDIIKSKRENNHKIN